MFHLGQEISGTKSMALCIPHQTEVVTSLMAMEGIIGYGASMRAQLLTIATMSGTFMAILQRELRDNVIMRTLTTLTSIDYERKSCYM